MKMNLELISPGFCGGAQPKTRAEIRVPSIRGQLRWWFRLLGGFASQRQKGMGLREQEDIIFGAARKDKCQASQLHVRVRLTRDAHSTPKNLRDMNKAYDFLLFPLRPADQKKNPNALQEAKRAVFDDCLPSFELHLNWRGDAEWGADIEALGFLFGYLGSLGMRSRRAMGALAFAPDNDQRIPLFAEVIRHFAEPGSLCIREIAMADREDPVSVLASWLRNWRAYLNQDMEPNEGAPGFSYAKNDHDVGFLFEKQGQTTYRPALGLPIIQRYRNANLTVNWEPAEEGMERFASPVILRPYRSPHTGLKKALVFFVDKYAWPPQAEVALRSGFANEGRHKVSLEMYQRMKQDPKLFPVKELSPD